MTILLAFPSRDGVVVAADRLTSGCEVSSEDAIKIANLPDGSSFAVLVAGRSSFGGRDAWAKCADVVAASNTRPRTVVELRDLLFDYFRGWTSRPGEVPTFEVVCIGPGDTATSVSIARFSILYDETGEPPYARFEQDVMAPFASGGEEKTEERVLRSLEAPWSSLSTDWPVWDQMLEHFRSLPATEVADLCRAAIAVEASPIHAEHSRTAT